MVPKSLQSLLMLSALQLAALLLFCKGFFPYKTYLSGHATEADAPTRLELSEIASDSAPQFDRLVFVLVDALRNDFVYEKTSGFSFVKSLISQGSAKPFTAKATAPTVTLPRIKALTTGTIPSFVDAILNIAESDTSSSLKYQDNWVYQLSNNGTNTINFFGDDTWMKLFPGLFSRTDGTTSFYVSDTVEVDKNVTSHVLPELQQPDWKALIFHYLGLDHIGHLSGPESPLMLDKQKEMDSVIRSIYETVAEDDRKRRELSHDAHGTLIVLCGDHGMNEAGNHGGSSESETSTAMIFMSPKYETRPTIKRQGTSQKQTFSTRDRYEYPLIDQIDIVPTLSMLLGFPIPKNNIGKVILELFNTHNALPTLRALQANAHQIGGVLKAHIGISYERISSIRDLNPVALAALESSEEVKSIQEAWNIHQLAIELHKEYAKLNSFENSEAEDLLSRTEYLYMKFISFANEHLSQTASSYDLRFMCTGMLLSFVSTVYYFQRLSSTDFPVKKSLSGKTTVTTCPKYIGYVLLSLAMYCISMFSSSYIEEEHNFWYYFLQTSWIILVIERFQGSRSAQNSNLQWIGTALLQMVLFRVIQNWNSTGDQHAGDIDVRYYLTTTYRNLSWHLLAATLIFNCIQCVRNLRQIQISASRTKDISQAARLIYGASKLVYLACVMLTSVLVVIYKVRSESSRERVPSLYQDLTTWELADRLNQVQLGRLIFNYGAASLFMLNVCIFIGKFVRKLDITDKRIAVSPKPYALLLLRVATPLLVLLSRTHNAILFAAFELQLELLHFWFGSEIETTSASNVASILQKPLAATSILLSMTQCTFFLMGSSNSLSSIDLGNAYIGVDDYNVGFTGLLTFVSNWAGSIWWTIAGISIIADGYWQCYKLVENEGTHVESTAALNRRDIDENPSNANDENEDEELESSTAEDGKSAISSDLLSYYSMYYLYFAIFFSVALSTLTISVTILRQHLFIWTVFSPKFLFQGAWITLYHYVLQTLISTVIIGFWIPWCIT